MCKLKIELFLFLSVVLLLSGCNGSGIDDASKRNENWVWWVDEATGEGTWIPFADYTTVKNGGFTTFFFNGNELLKGRLKDGEPVDTVFLFDIHGRLIKYEIYGSDSMVQYYLKDGPYTDYYSSGTIKQKGIVVNHTSSGWWACYYENGNVDWKESYINHTGWRDRYYENGQVRDSTFWKDGLQYGRSKYWYENGQLKEISDWKAGKQHGIYQFFFENGRVKEITMWTDGKREGKSEMWYENGQKKAEHFQ